MAITKTEVEKLARLARINLTPEEKEKFSEQISSILEYVKQIQEVDTSAVQNTVNQQASKNVWREDTVEPCQNVRDNIDQFPEKVGSLNKVPSVFERNKKT